MPIESFLHPIEGNVHNSAKKDMVNLNPSQMTRISKRQIQTPSVYLSKKNISLKNVKKFQILLQKLKLEVLLEIKTSGKHSQYLSNVLTEIC
jgi:hypothetical protein